MYMKEWKTSKPKVPKVYKVTVKDIEIYRDNISNITQLIAYLHNHKILENEKEIKQQLKNTVKFMDDMKFIFTKFATSDAIKIDK